MLLTFPAFIHSRHSLVRFLSYIRECSGDELDEFSAWARRQRDVMKPYLESISELLRDLAQREWRLPSLPELDIPEFDWPSFGVRWSDASAESAESASDSAESSSAEEQPELKIVGDE